MTSYRPALPSVRVSLTDKQLHPRPRCLSLQLLAPARLFHRGAVLLGVVNAATPAAALEAVPDVVDGDLELAAAADALELEGEQPPF